jgi:hypothetical protein
VNWKKLYRIYREERLTVRKRAAGSARSGRGPDGDPAGRRTALEPRLRVDALS